MYSAPAVEYPVIAAGIDWLTCTAKKGSPAAVLEGVAMVEVASQREKGVQPTHQLWQGFKGWRLDGLFFGTREHDVLLCLSGAQSNELGLQAIAASTNVSRIDFAVTICTNGEQLNLAHDAYTHYRTKPKQNGRPRKFDLMLNSTGGETFYLNKRIGDHFGRIYDKGIESNLAPAGMVWRFEVEFKRRVAKLQATKLPPQELLPAYVCDLVRSWWTLRDVETPWGVIDSEACFDNVSAAIAGDVLTWYRESLSVSIARSIKRFGLNAVLESLNLQKLVQPITRKSHGNL